MTITLVRIQIYNQNHPSVADPDLQMEAGGGGAGGSSTLWDKWGRSQKNASFWSRYRGGGPPGPSPESATALSLDSKGLKLFLNPWIPLSNKKVWRIKKMSWLLQILLTKAKGNTTKNRDENMDVDAQCNNV